MRVLLTGAGGFLGWHTRARLRALTNHQIIPVTRAQWDDLPDLAEGADAIIHLAGVNRGTHDEVAHGNVALAHDVAEAATKAGTPRVVFANSVQADNGTAYGAAKATAAQILGDVTRTTHGTFVDVLLPNLFGEGCRPNYNSFVATFVDAAVHGSLPAVSDRSIELLHVQQAAQWLIAALDCTPGVLRPSGTATTVAAVHDLIQRQHDTYRTGEIPVLGSPFAVDMFNTLRAATFPAANPLALTPHSDERGWLVEAVRAHGSPGQTFLSVTRPGRTRGDHFHLGKVERFVVTGGRARISLRRLFDTEVVSFWVDGDHPVAVDIPTLWVHNITNVGESDLTTLFWAHPLYDPAAPDTFWEQVSD